MPIMEVVLQQSYAGQECINRWNYLAQGTPAAVSFSFALVSAFGAIYDTVAYPTGTILNRMSALQVAGVQNEFIAAKDVYSITDFYETPFVPAYPGVAGGEGLTPVVAYGFRTNRVRSDIRRGTKRFVGVSETNQNTGGTFTSGAITQLETLGTVLSDNLEYDDEGNTLTFIPIVVSKEQYVPDPLRPERVAYRYYGTETEQLEHIAQGVVWSHYDQARSQTSRQYGRGR